MATRCTAKGPRAELAQLEHKCQALETKWLEPKWLLGKFQTPQKGIRSTIPIVCVCVCFFLNGVTV